MLPGGSVPSRTKQRALDRVEPAARRAQLGFLRVGRVEREVFAGYPGTSSAGPKEKTARKRSVDSATSRRACRRCCARRGRCASGRRSAGWREEVGRRRARRPPRRGSPLRARVVVAAAERGEHHDDAGLAEGGGGLVVARAGLLPEVVDGVTVAAGDPDDGRVLLAVAGVGRQIRGEPAEPLATTSPAERSSADSAPVRRFLRPPASLTNPAGPRSRRLRLPRDGRRGALAGAPRAALAPTAQSGTAGSSESVAWRGPGTSEVPPRTLNRSTR